METRSALINMQNDQIYHQLKRLNVGFFVYFRQQPLKSSETMETKVAHAEFTKMKLHQDSDAYKHDLEYIMVSFMDH